MKENEFQSTVLIPLFRAMGFKDVTAFGGGSLERGKDIVMWKVGDFGERVNYGVVVKAKKITDNAETSEGAMNVLNQVRQMLKTSYLNPVTGDRETVKKCVVACSKDITKEAMNSIEGELANALDKVVVWVHPGTNLFALIDQYLPVQAALEKLADVQKGLDQATKIVPYKIVASSDNTFSIVPKHPNAHKELPFEVKTHFDFPENPEGNEALKTLREFITKGKNAIIEGKFIKSIEVPDFIPEFLKPQVSENGKLILEHLKRNEILPARLERHLAAGGKVILDRLDMKLVEPGTEEFTISNENQPVPWRVAVTVDLKTGRIHFDYAYEYLGYNPVLHLKGLKFLTALTEEGSTSFIDVNHEANLLPNDNKSYPVDPESEREYSIMRGVLEDLVRIQQTFNARLIFNEDSLNPKERKNIFALAEIVRNGKLPVLVHNPCHSSMSLDKAKDATEIFEDEQINDIFIWQEQNAVRTVQSQQFELGPTLLSGTAYLKKESFGRILKDIAAEKPIIDFDFTFEGGKGILDFVNWKSDDRETRIPELKALLAEAAPYLV